MFRVALLTCGALVCSIAQGEGSPQVRYERRDDRVVVRADEVEVAHYIFRQGKISRPFFAQLHTRRGAQVSRNYPPREGDAADHAEFHPGLWLAFGDLGGADSWRLKAKVESAALKDEVESELPGFSVTNTYFADDGQRIVCKEVARYSYHVVSQGLLMLWDSEFSSDNADFAFGDQEEMGLGVRVHTPLAVASGKGGRMVDAEGRKNEKEIWGKSSPWCDYAGPLDGRFVGVMLMSHPKNFRPPWWHVRDYGLMVANPFGRNALARGERSSELVKQGDKLRLRFGVLLHDHASEKEFAPAAAYDDYLRLVEQAN